MDPVVIAIIVGGIACVAALIFLVVRSWRRYSRGLARMSEALGKFTPDQLHRANDGGVEYTYAFHTAKNKKPAFLIVQVDCPSESAFIVRAQTAFDRLGSAVGLALRITTPDPEFDRRFYITTDDPASAQATLEHEPSRRAIAEIFDLGFGEIQLKDNLLIARWTYFDPGQERNPDMIRETGLRLAFVAREVPAERSSPPPEGVWYRRSFWAVPALSFAASLAVFFLEPYPVLDTSAAFGRSLSYSLPALLGFLAIAFLAYRGRSTSHGEYVLLLLPSLITFPIAGYAGTLFVNGALDSSAATPHHTVVVEKSTRRTGGKHPRTVYEIRVPSWRPGEGVLTFEVKHGEYQNVRVHRSQVTFETKPGFLGFEWIVSRRLDPLPPGVGIRPPGFPGGPARPGRGRQDFIFFLAPDGFAHKPGLLGRFVARWPFCPKCPSVTVD